MTNALTWTLVAYLIIMGICLLVYLPRIICWFGAFSKQKHLVNSKKNRIAVLIPARNESKIIRGLLDCCKTQDYPADMFDVHLIVKDPSDPTIEIARQYGYKAHVAPDQHNKANALDKCIRDIRVSGEHYDAYLVIDADCWIEKDCLTEFNNAMASGKDIITGKKIVKNYYAKDKKAATLSASCNGLIWTMMDELGNRFKSDHDLRTMTVTCGILFTAKVIDQLKGFPFDKTMTEDMELMFANPLNGFSTYYTSYAHIYMDEATSLKVTDMRRTRWIKGYVAAKRIYTPELKMDLKSPKDKLERYFLTGMYPVFVMYGITVAFFFISLIWSIVLFGQQEMANAYLALANAGYAFLFAYVTLFILTAFCLIVDRKYIKCSVWKKIAILFAHPLFYMGYFYISLEALFFHKEEKWEPVERTVALEEK